jgi:hypothetical protein
LIDWLTPPEYADDRIHGLLTGYDRWVQKYGDRTARRMFLVQSIGAVFGFWVYWLGKHINLLKLTILLTHGPRSTSFSKPEDAEAFAKRFDGKRLPTGSRRSP